jgi:hypothetical protein
MVYWIIAVLAGGVFLWQFFKGGKDKARKATKGGVSAFIGVREMPLDAPPTDTTKPSPAVKAKLKMSLSFKPPFLRFKKVKPAISPQSSPDAIKSIGEPTPPPPKRYEPCEVYLYDDQTRKCGPYTLSGGDVGDIIAKNGTLGRPRSRDGVYMYHIRKSKDGEFIPKRFSWNAENSSMKLFRALHHPELTGIWDVTPEQGMLAKWGWAILFAGGVIFLMWTSING